MISKGYDFDDLLLVPKLSSVNSRNDVDLSVKLSDFLTLKVPIIASPMKGMIGAELIAKLSELGGIGILHRFHNDEESFWIDMNKLAGTAFGISTNISTDNFFKTIIENYSPKIICVDVANGYLDTVTKRVSAIKDFIVRYNHKCLVMAGNVATYEGMKNLKNAGADLVRVGIGPGKLCTTRNFTGVGIPQLTAIERCGTISGVVADGGIRNSGDAVKALAMGADVLMMGSLFSQCYESEHDGVIYGAASRKIQDEYYHSVKSVEGIEVPAEKRISLNDFLTEFTWGMRSGFTYLNARNITELQTNAEFIEVGSGSIKDLK